MLLRKIWKDFHTQQTLYGSLSNDDFDGSRTALRVWEHALKSSADNQLDGIHVDQIAEMSANADRSGLFISIASALHNFLLMYFFFTRL
jgi:hypothetical protein